MEHIPTVGCDRIHILGRIDFHIEPQLQTDYASIQVIGRDTILCCVHLNSQIYSDHVSRREIVIEQIINDILKLENGLNTTNTIIVGDFNINPYDNSCVNARYFHGIPIYEDAMRESRNIAGKEFRMFYNPMWNFLGDFKEPYGTYYRSAADTFNPYWHIYDQVIIRPSLRSRFVDGNLKIITGSANVSLLDKNKHPNHRMFFMKYGTAHYPVQFTLEESIAENIGLNGKYIQICNSRNEVEDLIVKILTSKKVLRVMQELIRIHQAKSSNNIPDSLHDGTSNAE